MKTNGTLNFAAKLKGMPVLDPESGEKIGLVSDLILDPAQGKLLGIAFTRPDKETLAIKAEDLHIGHDAIMMTGGHPAALDFSSELSRGILATKILGASVVTERGSHIGTLESVWISPEDRQVYYRIAESALQKMFGGGFYMSGQIPRAISPDARRVIVPPDRKEYAKNSLSDFHKAAGDAP